ncbi:MAG TPA: hypothetical protein VNG33_06915 [Polyangiaceae bacterium]|nr:hypothetical protein [Polyangiaceae bacterium]
MLEVGEAAGPIAAEAAIGCSTGLDHFGGEYVLAAVQDRGPTRVSLAITDRRTICSGWAKNSGKGTLRFCIPHAELARVELKQRMLSNHFRLVHSSGSEHKVSMPVVTEQLGRFYSALVEVPASRRVPANSGVPQPTATDPAACRAVTELLAFDDAPVRAILALTGERVHTGQLDATTGYDFACRALLLHRSTVSGPGFNAQQWLSPLCASDLVQVMAHFYGPPYHQQHSGSWGLFDFRLDNPNSAGAGSAVVTALGVASYLTLGVGFSPARVVGRQLAKPPALTGFRLVCSDMPSSTAYALQVRGAGLELSNVPLAVWIHQRANHMAQMVLHRRAAYGWALDFHTLISAK